MFQNSGTSSQALIHGGWELSHALFGNTNLCRGDMGIRFDSLGNFVLPYILKNIKYTSAVTSFFLLKLIFASCV